MDFESTKDRKIYVLWYSTVQHRVCSTIRSFYDVLDILLYNVLLEGQSCHTQEMLVIVYI
jgi:hypothetical protein